MSHYNEKLIKSFITATCFGSSYRDIFRLSPKKCYIQLAMFYTVRDLVLYVINIYIYILHGAESFLRANCFVASKEIPRISRNPKVHYRTHKRPPPVSILGQPNPVHIPTSHLLEIHPNIIPTHLSLGLPSGLLPSGFPSKTLYTPLSSPIRATCPANIRVALSNSIT